MKTQTDVAHLSRYRQDSVVLNMCATATTR